MNIKDTWEERIKNLADESKASGEKAWNESINKTQTKQAKLISKKTGIDVSEVLDTIKEEKDWSKVLDERALNKTLDSLDGLAPKKGIASLLGGGITADEARALFEPDPDTNKAKYKPTGFSSMTERERIKALTYMKRDSLHAEGKAIGLFGMKDGHVPSKKALEAAGKGSRALYALKTTAEAIPGVGLFTAAGRDVYASNMGILTAHSKIQMANSGIIGKLAIGLGTGLTGLATAYTAANADNVAIEMMATTAMSIGLQSGWRSGKAISSAIGGTGHIPRVALGALGGATGAIVGYGSFKALEDLGSSNSVLVGLANKISKRENMYNGPQDTRVSATMRQAALQKLSSSSLNNRGQLLGNEAQTLRGAPMG